jgi:uncharacterized protein (DUF934 family)
MALIKNHELTPDTYTRIAGDAELPDQGGVLVDLQRWQDDWQSLGRRGSPVGVWLTSDQHPEIIADDLDQIDLVALEFPSFRDGRAYSYARLLRDRYGFSGELRAVGDVLPDQLLYMHRVGFDAFELAGQDPLSDYQTALEEFDVFYQPAADARATALRLRHARG